MNFADAVPNSAAGEVFNATSHINLLSNINLMSILLKSVSKTRSFPKTKSHIEDSYDYIIAGGGTAGSVVANRLSEMPCVSVLLLEAGGDPPPITEVPIMTRGLLETDIDWLYMSEPQKHGAFSQEDHSVRMHSGKALGGTSVINAMLNIRGNRKNYDDWEAEGATGWGYESCLHYFKKLEDNKNKKYLDRGFHAKGGPVTMEKPADTSVLKEPIRQATADMGYNVIDINGMNQTGIFDVELTMRNKQRCSTAKAYLVPAENRKNLHIMKNAFVRKIIFENKTAVGVEMEYNGTRMNVRAKREVIVSIGALRTPQLLMLSGIGPKEELKRFNISVVADLAVGENLMDHSAAISIYELTQKIKPFQLVSQNPKNLLEYVYKREGPFSSIQVPLLAFFDAMNKTVDFPMQQVYFYEYAVIDALINLNLKDGIYDKYYKPYEEKTVYACLSSTVQPKSRGTVTLRSTDPHDYPKIDPKYYQHPDDLTDIVEGLKFCHEVSKHPALQKLEARLIDLDTSFPGCGNFRGNVENYFRCLAKQVIFVFWHFSGTARMGRIDDPRSVVDPKLRVIGVKNLRVVSAAVMPIIPSGNTNVPTMMVAEKASDIIKEDIKCEGRKKGRQEKKR